MRRWFLSYHSPDEALAKRLKTAIENKDPSARVFFAPSHLRAGGSWSAQLAQEIADADAFILLVGETGVGNWQVLEYDEALDKRTNSLNLSPTQAPSRTEFRIILNLLDGQPAPGLQFLRRLHWIVSPDPASEETVGRLFLAVTRDDTSTPGELWRYTSPYRGLEALEEKDSDYFFGRKRETVDVLSALANAPGQLPILIGNSGVGKSSLAKAGVLAALKRQAWPEGAPAPNAWPAAFQDSRQWCFLSLKPGTDPLKALVESFFDLWQFDATDPNRVKDQNSWIELLRERKATLSDLIDATERRRIERHQPKPPGFLLYVDQAEELYVRAEEEQARRFSQLLAQALPDPRLRAIMSLRSDFLGQLQNDEPLFKARRQIDVAPLREEALREIVTRPAQLLAARFETDKLVDIITKSAVEDSIKDVGALPLLSYTLDDMWTTMVKRGDGTLRFPAASFDLSTVLVERADKFLAIHPGDEETLRRILTLRLATVRDDGQPTRRRAVRAEFSKKEWKLVSDLADYPNRLLVTVTTETGETWAEVAHEAIFRRWGKLREWIAAEREFLAWRSGLETARRAWETTADESKDDAVLMGSALSTAQSWLAKRKEDLLESDRIFIAQSIERDKTSRGRARQVRILAYALLVGIIAILVAWINNAFIYEQLRTYAVVRPFMHGKVLPYVLTAAAEQALKPSNTFRECAVEQGKDYCPQMTVVPARSFSMGSPPNETGRFPNEDPPHDVTIAKPFAVSTFELTFDEWDTCVAYGDCPDGISASGFGRGQQPVINVTWADAQRYVAWLSRTTGKPYRLLTEAEYEYAARGGARTAYPWGETIGVNNADCIDCGSLWDGREPAPVSSFAANGFGLFGVVGSVWEWVEDCVHRDYTGAPADGSAWVEGGNCDSRTVRGGNWKLTPANVRSATRNSYSADGRDSGLGFRVGRTLTTP